MDFCTRGRITVISLLLVAPLAAQEAGGGTDHVSAIKESLQTSQKALHGYKWVETTVISVNGEEKSSTQKSCYYGADGALQKTPIGESEAESKDPRGLRGRIAKKKKAEITDSMQEAVGLVKQYVPPDAAKIQAAREQGNLSVVPPDELGNVKVVIKDYLKPGDSITLGANTSNNRLTGMVVSTFTDSAKDAVNLQVSFGTLNDGTIYADSTILTVASQKLEVTVTNAGYEKSGG